MPDAAADTALMRAAALDAGKVAMRYFGGTFRVEEKPDGLGPVTEADLAVNALLEAELRAARPDYGWLSEESADTPDRQQAERVFIVDPIDGTRSFVAGEPGFSISLAVVERGTVTSAVIHLPARGETYEATAGRGALRDGQPLCVSAPIRIEAASVLTSRPQLAPEHWPGGVPGLTRHFRPSLAWRMALVACGRYDSMLSFRDCFEWDIAAGALIAAEAGATVSDGQGRKPVFNSNAARVPGIIAASPGLHSQILAHRRPID